MNKKAVRKLSGMKFSVFAPNGKSFSNGLRHAMVDFKSKKFKKTILVEDNKLCSQGSKNKVILAEYDSNDRAEEIKSKLLSAYDREQSDYFLPKE